MIQEHLATADEQGETISDGEEGDNNWRWPGWLDRGY
jgi:hypothetical protein